MTGGREDREVECDYGQGRKECLTWSGIGCEAVSGVGGSMARHYCFGMRNETGESYYEYENTGS